ncbi:SufE family protein [Devosia sp. YIM 151766]|uniref:SufE family protein n=1 Tax=Devosia sp. YIM 151766 TaxID=3017325 RepID=UPI00255C96C8|nr:SufE family protein [Devosia sp. YIM 151766]WIY53646.1 SufE family protein [Devosia sp. YIM 151766]
MNQPQPFQDIADNLSFLDDWEDRYRYLIELGQALPKLDEAERSAANKVNGCVSQVWLVAEPETVDGAPGLKFRGESDAMIVQGLVALLLALYSDRSAREIADTDAIALFDELGLREHLTTQRSNGLAAMVGRIRGAGRAALG